MGTSVISPTLIGCPALSSSNFNAAAPSVSSLADRPATVVGAGPYGLATAAYAQERGVNQQLLGVPMAFWKHGMPKGLILRSNKSEHISLDPSGKYTFDRYLGSEDHSDTGLHSISLDTYLDYANWFQENASLTAYPHLVQQLDLVGRLFEAQLDDGSMVRARNVVIATGLGVHKNLSELAPSLPLSRYRHTCDLGDLEYLRGQRCLILGGRQSAFEWAALIAEVGAAMVHLAYRHPTPAFDEADWSSLEEPARQASSDRRWFRNLSSEEKAESIQRLWAQGRLKVEPWLESRVQKENIHLWPCATVIACEQLADGTMVAELDTGVTMPLDYVVFATGYKIEVGNFSFLSRRSILPLLKAEEGYPVLDEDFQSSVPGLFFIGPAAARDFGPALSFVIGCPIAGKVVVQRTLST